jgi:MSHA pilin protein MshD
MPANRRRNAGFTLIELVIGIALLAVVMTLIISAFLPMLNKQSQPIYQVRAAELGQAMLQEVLSRSFDENSDRSGKTVAGLYPYCGAIDAANTTTEVSTGNCSSTLGADTGETYPQFDDVDDYNAFCNSPISGTVLAGLQNLNASLYDNYTVSVCVVNAPDLVGQTSGRTDVAKKITVTVTTPASEAVTFISYRSNYG